MPQLVCKCGKLGPRYAEGKTPLKVEEHACRCDHPTVDTRAEARKYGGRYLYRPKSPLYDTMWRCYGCGTHEAGPPRLSYDVYDLRDRW